MKIRLYHANLALLGEETPLVRGEVHTDGDRITYAGSDAPAQDAAFDREIDCGGGVLLPGFCNAHSHAAMTFLRSLADDLPLQAWLTQKVFPGEAKLTEEDAYVFTKLAILEYLSGGITSMFDMYMHRDAVAAAAMDAGFRAVIMDGANDYGGSAARSSAELARIGALSPLISYQLGIHGEYTTATPLICEIIELVREKKMPFYAHLSETEAEVKGCVERHGLPPIEYLDSLGAFEYGGGGFHCVHCTAREMDIMAEKGLYAVSCPASNLKLGSGIAPLHEMHARGVRLALGTDGAASNNALDFFREMYLASCLQKVRHGADAMGAAQVLRMATETGAAAMGLPNCGRLAAGMQADLALVDVSAPNMQPVHNLLNNLVYAGSPRNVKLTMVAGRELYEDGRFFIGQAPEMIYEKAAAAAARIFGA